MAANDISQLVVQGNVAGQNHVHTLHFKHIGLTSTEQNLIDAWQTSCRTLYRALFHTVDSPVQMITANHVCGTVPLRASAQEVSLAGSILGTKTLSGHLASPHEAVITSIRTAFAGKSYRGRSYLGGLAEGEMNTGIHDSAAKPAYEAYYQSILTEFASGGAHPDFRWFVFSPTLAAVGGTQCQNAGAEVTTFVVRPHIATMRSRKIGHGT